MRTNGHILPRFYPWRSQKGFSLLELCVVVAVTATLSALMLPALSTAKEKSRRTVCRNNMRQFAAACYIFGTDNNDYFPSGFNNLSQPVSMILADTTFKTLSSCAGSPKIFDCPNLEIDTIARTNNNYRGIRIGYNYVAGVDQNTLPKTKGATERKPSPMRLSDPGTNVLIADANFWSDTGDRIRIAPHTSIGSVVQTVGSASAVPNYAETGFAGGNVALLDLSVCWRPINSMNVYQVAVDVPGRMAEPISCFGKW